MATSNILDAFIKQTYGSIEKAKESDKLADINPNANQNDNDLGKHMEFEADQKFRQELASKMTNKPISQSMSIPTRLKDGELDNQTISHKNFKNYDHSLEEHRGHKLGLIKIKEEKVGDVQEMFNNMFNDDSNLIQ